MTRTALVLLAVTPMASLAEAQTVASFDRLALVVNQGDHVTLTDSSGRALRGRILDLSPSTLALSVNGVRQEVLGAEVATIRRPRRDPLKNGAVTGFLSGAGIAAGLLLGSRCADARVALYVGSLFGAAGAGIGAGVDALIQGEHVIYTAPRTAPGASRGFTVAPVVSRGGGGLSASFGF